MYGPPSKSTVEKYERAARLKLEGNTWDQIAPKIERKDGASARSIVKARPELWAQAKAKARELYADLLESEALLTARELMRPTRHVFDDHGRRQRHPDGAFVMEARPENIRESALHSVLNHVRLLQGITVRHAGFIEHKVTPDEAERYERELRELGIGGNGRFNVRLNGN